MEPLSHIQRTMYDYIAHCLQAEGMPPTNREICCELGLSSTAHVDHHLNALVKKGWITKRAGKSRGIKLIQPASGIPVKGIIAAGLPLEIYPDAPSIPRVEVV
jgi:repressor LexA